MLAETFAWWLVLVAVGFVALPITMVLFRNLPGRGIAFAKPVGLLLCGYLFWLALTAQVLPNRPGSVVWVLLLIGAIDFVILRRSWPELRLALSERWRLVAVAEVVFALGLFMAAHIRSFIPEIVGTEKPMDFMLLNAASRSTYYPPEDPWLAGFSVSYYYFGYVIQAMVAKLAAVSTAVAFNLGLASTAALAATAAFGLGYELAASLRRVSLGVAAGVGLAAVMLVAVMGNLQGVLEFGAANGVLPDSVIQRVDIANLEAARESDACLLPVACISYPTEQSSFWWWWRATRISPDANSITEFPFFSFLLGDLHPHVMSIPYVLAVVALGLALWRSPHRLSFDSWRRSPALLLLVAVLLGGLGFLNTWDLPTFGFLLALLVVLRNVAGGPKPHVETLRDSLGFLAPLALLALVLYLPFYLGFSSQAGGFDVVRDQATRPLHSFLFWGPLLAVCLPLPAVRLLHKPAAGTLERFWTVLLLPLALFTVWTVVVVVAHGGGALGDAVSARGWNWLTTLFFAGALALCLAALWREAETSDEEATTVVPVLTAMSVAMLLVFGAELFYVQDVFNSRLNSVFKLYYQAWLLLGVCGAFSAYWLLARRPAREGSQQYRFAGRAWGALAALLVAGALLYPLGATLSRTEGLARPNRSLDGLAYARQNMPDDYALVQWLRTRAGERERMVEAIGNPYSTAARASAWSGVPTVLGWPGHQLQWGRAGDILAARRQDVDLVYRTESLADAVAILQQYDVAYVFVGSVERSTYPAAGLQKFEDGLPVVLRSGQSVLYRVPPQGFVIEGASR
jgi:YYY domain-containing protein